MGDGEQIEEEKDQEEDKEGLLQGKFLNKSAALPLQRQPLMEEKDLGSIQAKRVVQCTDFSEEDKEIQTKQSTAAITPVLQPLIENNEEPKDEEITVRAKSLIQKAASQKEENQELQTKPLVLSAASFMQRQAENDQNAENNDATIEEKLTNETYGHQLQRQPAIEEEAEPIQAISAASVSESFEAGEDIESRLSRSKGSGSPLPDPVRNYMEPRFGVDFGHVRFHTGSDSLQMNRDIGAQAFTHGSDIYYGPGSSPTNLELTAHELTHVVQQTHGIQRRMHSLGESFLSVNISRDSLAKPIAIALRSVAVQRDNEDREPVIPQRYHGLLTPSLTEAEQRALQQATSGAGLVQRIRRRDQIREQLADIARRVNGGNGDISEGTTFQEYDRLIQMEGTLTREIDDHLAELGVNDEVELVHLVQDRFPTMFLAEAKDVALGMLADNEAEARSELERYSQQVCSPDVEGLLAADQQLAELSPVPIEISIQSAERALAMYRPTAGVATSDELATMIPENERSVMVDIANLERNRARLNQQRAIYNATRYAFARQYPILLSNGYRPGSFSEAPLDQLEQMVAEPLQQIIENIGRVRNAINEDELKVWNMHYVLAVTRQRLGVESPILTEAINARIESAQRDETFMSWVTAALAITTTLIAGLLFTPAAGAAVAAGWGIVSLANRIDELRNESAAENVALDPAVADLSLNEPTLAWVLLDAVFLGLDLALVAQALRPAARLLSQNPTALSLHVFQQRTAVELGDAAADQLTRRAAQRFGIEVTEEIAERQLNQGRTILAGLGLSDEAIARVLSKGTDLNQVKGQLFEELMNVEVGRRLAAGSDELLGVADAARVEFITGDRIRDLANLQLTDGMIVRRLGDGAVEVVTVLEAKAGRGAAQGLRSTSHGIGDPEEFAHFVIEERQAQVIQTLRRAGLTEDANLVAAGSENVSDAAIDAIASEPTLRRAVTQAELGGQVRRDVERLYPNFEEDTTTILIDGVPTSVRLSPTRTRFIGAVPEDVATSSISRHLREQAFNFESLQLGGKANDLTSLAQRLIDSQGEIAGAAQ